MFLSQHDLDLIVKASANHPLLIIILVFISGGLFVHTLFSKNILTTECNKEYHKLELRLTGIQAELDQYHNENKEELKRLRKMVEKNK